MAENIIKVVTEQVILYKEDQGSFGERQKLSSGLSSKEKDSWAQLYFENYQILLSYTLRNGFSPSDAEELVAEALLAHTKVLIGSRKLTLAHRHGYLAY